VCTVYVCVTASCRCHVMWLCCVCAMDMCVTVNAMYVCNRHESVVHFLYVYLYVSEMCAWYVFERSICGRKCVCL
jgi:hypothetical protein